MQLLPRYNKQGICHTNLVHHPALMNDIIKLEEERKEGRKEGRSLLVITASASQPASRPGDGQTDSSDGSSTNVPRRHYCHCTALGLSVFSAMGWRRDRVVKEGATCGANDSADDNWKCFAPNCRKWDEPAGQCHYVAS